MKNISKEILESGRPKKPLEAINYCLKQLYADVSHNVTDQICVDLTYEEIIGALLAGRDCLEKNGK